MNYKIIGSRGVLEEGTPFLMDEGKDLLITFDRSSDGDMIRVSDGKTKTFVIKTQNGEVTIPNTKLHCGLWYVEKFNEAATEKVICQPFVVQSLATKTKGIICYPETDWLMKTVTELLEEVETLTNWKNEVADKIHEHKIIK